MKLAKKNVSEALKKTNANISLAAKLLGVARSSLYRFVERMPELKQMIVDERESLIDIAENALKSAVIEKEAWAVCFTLKTLGKARGYVERSEVEHSGTGGGPIKIAAVDYRIAIKPLLAESNENAITTQTEG